MPSGRVTKLRNGRACGASRMGDPHALRLLMIRRRYLADFARLSNSCLALNSSPAWQAS
jgi:hypothetical protein